MTRVSLNQILNTKMTKQNKKCDFTKKWNFFIKNRSNKFQKSMCEGVGDKKNMKM
jgi:hypothetical protein